MTAFSFKDLPPLATFDDMSVSEILGNRPKTGPEQQDIGPCEAFEFGRPYMGLWDVYGDGTSQGLANRLLACAESNAHPDWVGYSEKALEGDGDVVDRLVTLSEGLKLARWPQSPQDVHREIECRKAGVFVIQKFYAPVTFEGEINAGTCSGL